MPKPFVAVIGSLLLVLAGVSFASPASAAPLDVTAIESLDLAPGMLVSSDAPGDPRGLSVLSSPMDGFPTKGGSALILSSGDASIVPGAPNGQIDSTVLDGPGGADGNDLSQVSLELAPPATAKCLSFDFMFLSEEYPQYVGSNYNDIFTAELNESVFQLENNQVVAPNNFAFDSEGNPVSVNTLFGFSEASQSQLNGRSPALKAVTPIEKDSGTGKMKLILSVQDLGDSIYDSAAVVDNVQWMYNANCKEGTTPIEDTDRDGLSDAWETQGIDYDDDGTPELDLPAMGADPQHKDLFIEVDWMHKQPQCVWFICWGERNFAPQQSAIDDVVAAFAAAPVSNPDGVSGITAHIDAGPNSTMNPRTGTKWGAMSRASSVGHLASLGTMSGSTYNWSAFEAIKSSNFGFMRRDVFHYSLFADTYAGSGSSGISRGIPASDFIVSDGDKSWGGGFTLIQERGTFMHELGHNLDLYHGGGPSGTLNYNASYRSIMNYKYQLTGLLPGAVLDYSRGTPYDDWANIRFDGGSVGDLGEVNPLPDTTVSDSIDPDIAKSTDAYASSGDGLIHVVGPTVIARNTADQAILVDVTNTGPTEADFTVKPSADWVGSGSIRVPGSSTARMRLVVNADAAPLGAHEVGVKLLNEGTLRSQETLAVNVVDLTDPATIEAAEEALSKLVNPPEGLDPEVLGALRTHLKVEPTPTLTPTPTPSVQLAAQSVAKPAAKLKKGKSAKVAKKTKQGSSLSWKSTTKKVCTVKKYKVKALKKGTCKLKATAPARPGFTAYTHNFKIKVT